jgi:hypothetical protein
MGTVEIAEALGVTKGLISQAAAPTPPASKPQAATKPAQVITAADDPHASLERARAAEAQSYAALLAGREGGASPEDLRKLSTTYFAARRNRQNSEDFADQWQRRQRITLLYDEAVEIVSRPHNAAKQMLEVMPKSLAPRLFGQPQKAIEAALGQWADNLTEILRQAP